MKNSLKQNLKAAVLMVFLALAAQPCALAGFLDILKDEDDEKPTNSSAITGQYRDRQAADAAESAGVPGANGFVGASNSSFTDDNDDVKLGPSGFRSAFSELMKESFPRDDFSKRLNLARKNIERGEKMMQACGNNHDKPEYKKGKVMRDIGEKSLGELKSDPRYAAEFGNDPEPLMHTETKTETKRVIPDSL